MKSILFASQQLQAPVGSGGGEISIFELLSYLQQTGRYRVQSLGAFRYAELPAIVQVLDDLGIEHGLRQEFASIVSKRHSYRYPARAFLEYTLSGAYTCRLARTDHHFETLQEMIAREDPDAIVVQAAGSKRVVEALGCLKTPIYLFIRNVAIIPAYDTPLPANVRVLASSHYLVDVLARRGIQAQCLYPPVKATRYHSPDRRRSNDRYTVLFVNPIFEKGLFVFLHLVATFPDVQFVTIEGWQPVGQKIAQQLEAESNVTWLRKTWAMESIYQMADLVIVPSQIEEAFGRVVPEAHAAGVPTLASRAGGLPEASGDAGMLVDRYTDPRAWAAALQEILADVEGLASRREALLENAARFAPERIGKRFEALLEDSNSWDDGN